MKRKDIKEKVFEYISGKYLVKPEYPWEKYDQSCVFRHKENGKWFGLIMDVRGDKVGLESPDVIYVMNLKIDDPIFHDLLVKQKGIIPAYHMNKKNWISVRLNGDVPEKNVFDLIDASFEATAPKRRKAKVIAREPKEWIIPSNPKYYDVIAAFKASDVINWKQGRGIMRGDTVFLYVGAPVSAILYKCMVLETDIPYDYSDKNLTITALMKIKLLKQYEPDEFTFERLNDEFKIFAIRGPRGTTPSLSAALNG